MIWVWDGAALISDPAIIRGNTVVEKTQMNLEVEVTSVGIKWKTASVYHFALIIWK